MQTATRRRTIRAVALSVAVHGAVLTVLALHAPRLRVPEEMAGPPEPIIPILILPRLPPAAAGSAAGDSFIRLHRRPVRPRELPAHVAPLLTPPPPDTAAPPPAAAPASEATPAAPPAGPDLATVLRRSRIGCANASVLGLSRAEQEACQQQLGQGAASAPFIAPPMSPAKRAELEAAGARKDATVRAREAPLSGSAPTLQAEPQDYSGEPYITGGGASALGPVAYPASKRGARKLEPLPP
jgi:hypothetical protein